MSANDVERLIEAHKGLVNAVGRGFGRLANDPDLLQCGMIGLWRAAEHWDGQRPFAPYAMACIRNAMYSYLRQIARWEPPVDQSAAEVWGAVPPEEDGTVPLLGRIRAACGNSREGLVLSALACGVSKQAVAAALGINTYQVTRLAQKGWKRLTRV